MRTIKIFLASSVVEFKRERQELAAFANTINKDIVKREIFFELIMCEDLSNAMAKERKQDEYNEHIRESDFVLILIGKTVGQYTIEEFNVARECYKKCGKPQIFTYFKEFPQGEEVQESVLDFMELLVKENKHYYNRYTDLETVKAYLSQVIYGRALELQDGQLLLDEQPVMVLENVPFYKGGQALQQKRERKKALEEEYAALMPRLAKNPSEDGLQKKKKELEQERGALQKAIGQMEADMLRERQETVRKRQLGMHMNWREKKAMEFVDKGDYESAKNILRDAQWEEEVRQSEENLERFHGEGRERKLVEIRRYIYGKRLLISYLKITGLDQESVEEIKAIYENITEKALRYRIEQKVLQEYAEFLMGQNCVQQGIAVAEKLRQHCTQDEKTLTKYKAEILLWLGELYADYEVREFEKSGQCILEALELIPLIYNDLEREGLTALAKTKRAIRLRGIGNVKEAERWSREALELSAGLAERNPQDGTLRWILGESMQNSANQMKRMGQMKEAEKLGRKSVEIFEDLAGNYPSDPSWCSLFPDRVDMAYRLQGGYSYLANIMYEEKREEEAESLCRKALETGRSIAGRNSHGNERYMARVCRNLAELLGKRGNQRESLEEAESLYQESRQIFKSLFDRNPQCYRDEAAEICIRLGMFRERNNTWGVIEKRPRYRGGRGKDGTYPENFYREALSFYNGMEHRWNNEKFALANYKLAQSRKYNADAPANNVYYKRAFYIYSYLSKSNEIATVCLAWAINKYKCRFYDKMQRNIQEDSIWEKWLESNKREYEEMKPLFQKALDIYRRLYDKNPSKMLQWRILTCYKEWGTVLWKLMYRVEEADGMYEEACKIAQQFETDDTYMMRVSDIYLKRAMILETKGNTMASREFLHKWRNCVERYKSQKQINNQEENHNE